MNAIFATATLVAALATASAWAAQPASPPVGAGGQSAHAHSMEGMDEKSMHEMCKSVMGKDMSNKSVHEHSRDKSGVAMWPNGKPLTKEEMAEMHKKCSAMMSTGTGTKAP
ncbi:hypothetical protein LJR219_001503 [Phenylobacterium sp. LjRoot219]|uniref:hypothetical protein n=1 Tax=Phenylobacterium sp. LjRoot219 TaxID=3342283 RepID=UPI003ECEBEDA